MVYNYTKPRGPIAAMYSSPGPCYGLPGLFGQSTHDPRSVHAKGPAHAFGIKHGRWIDECSPGPCYAPGRYYRDGKDGTPSYSMSDRVKSAPAMKAPGPGAYSPERSGQQSYFRPPAYTFGLRNKHRKMDGTPAPNNYTLDSMLGKTTRAGKRQAPCYSMPGRTSQGAFFQDLAKTPGPGAYGTIPPDMVKSRPPVYSLTGRNTMPGDNTTKPGPGAHSPEKSQSSKRVRAPTFHMGIRHSPYVAPLIVC